MDVDLDLDLNPNLNLDLDCGSPLEPQSESEIMSLNSSAFSFFLEPFKTSVVSLGSDGSERSWFASSASVILPNSINNNCQRLNKYRTDDLIYFHSLCSFSSIGA